MNLKTQTLSFQKLCTAFAGAAILVSTLLSASSASAQTGSEVQLPADATSWLNSAPISTETLRGKAAILYFFEEG